MSDDVVSNLKKPSAWFRVLFMAGFAIALYLTGVILLVLMLAQIVFTLLTGEDNSNLRRLGASLTRYVTEILAFLTYNSEQKPFPFSEFPVDVTPAGATGSDSESVVTEPVITEPDVSEPVAAAPGDVPPANTEQANAETNVPQPDTRQTNETQSLASRSSDEAQAVADDDGFRNPTAGMDTPQSDAAKSRRGAGRKKQSNTAEAPPTDD